MAKNLCVAEGSDLEKGSGKIIWTPSDKDRGDRDAEGPKRPRDVPKDYPGDPGDNQGGEPGKRDQREVVRF